MDIIRVPAGCKVLFGGISAQMKKKTALHPIEDKIDDALDSILTARTREDARKRILEVMKESYISGVHSGFDSACIKTNGR